MKHFPSLEVGSREGKGYNKIDDSISLAAVTEGLTKGNYWPKFSITLVKQKAEKLYLPW